MNSKTKKTLYLILKVIWFLFGGLILLWTIFWFMKMYTINSLGVVGIVPLFAMGLYGLGIFVGITLLFLLIKWIIKWKQKKSLKQEKSLHK